MTTKADVTQSNINVTQTRKRLTEFWEKALDEAGNFEWTFGDPAATEFAVRIWVGYDEADSVLVDVIYPASEVAIVKDDDGPTEKELKTIEDLAYENSDLLDKDVAEFAHTIYGYLQGLSSHPSLIDTLWNDWIKSKDEAFKVASAYKEVVALQGGGPPQPYRPPNHKLLARQYERDRERRLRKEAQERQEQLHRAALALRNRDDVVEARGWMLFQGMNVPTDPLSKYLQRVFAFESTFLLWQKESLTTIPSVISRIPWLQEVNFSQNKLRVLPEALFNLPKLKRLFLHGNQLKVLPNLGNLVELEILDVHDNQISVIPADIGLVSRLQSLDFEKNKIRVIPTEIGELKQLSHLNLAKNLVKIVPASLVELTNLWYLNLKLNPIVNLPPHIYLQGTAASMAYLKNQVTDASKVQASSIISDFSILKDRMPEPTPGVTIPQESRFLADLILRSTPDEGSEEAVESHQVHRLIICARSIVIAETLDNIKKSGIELPVDSTSGLPVLVLKLNAEQLNILVTYLYTDGYTAPKLSLVATTLTMPEEQVIEAVKLNQIMTLNHSKSLERASETASTFKLAYLKYLVDKNLRAVAEENSRYLTDIKQVYTRLVDIASPLGGLSIPAPTSSISEATQVEQATPFGLLPACDVTFTFPLHPNYPPISAHKVILCARSKFLSSLLTGGLLESKQRIVALNDIEPEVFKNIVEFCYSDDVYNLNGETIMDLLAAARLYGLDRLLGIVESVVGYSLDVENVSGILSIAHLYSLARLGRACKFFVLSNWESVTRSEGWKDLSEAIVAKLTSTAIEWGIIE